MHGYNTPRHQESSEKGYQIHDIWYTIQGEGPFAGLPAVFIRLTGCNYRCHWCFVEGTPIQTPEGIVAIEDIELGQMVWSYDRDEGNFVKGKVIRKYQSLADALVSVTYNGSTVMCTERHPFLIHDEPGVVDAGWLDTKNDRLFGYPDRKKVKIEHLLRENGDERTVYNLEIDKYHNYVVNGAVVKNCDTTWDDEKDPYVGILNIVTRIKLVAPDCRLIVFTGGEPTRWDLNDLFEALPDYQIQLETAGTFWQPCFLNPNVTIVCSPKVAKVHPKIHEHCQHWKYVVTAGDAATKDGLPIIGTQRGTSKHFEDSQEPWKGGPMARFPQDRKVEVYLQPCDEGDTIKNKANMDHMVKIAMKYGYRAGLQLHKLFNVL